MATQISPKKQWMPEPVVWRFSTIGLQPSKFWAEEFFPDVSDGYIVSRTHKATNGFGRSVRSRFPKVRMSQESLHLAQEKYPPCPGLLEARANTNYEKKHKKSM